MHAVARALLVGASVAIACGGRTTLDAPDADLDFPAHSTCASADGVRLCGAGCPALGPDACAGYGCTSVLDYADHSTTAGVCWSDTGETQFLCDDCTIGDACLARTEDRLECVPADVCAALWDLGVTDVCRYTDKRRYDHRPLPIASGCPATTKNEWHACGGDCAPCPNGTRCDGVSPDHPFGICHGGFNSVTPYDSSISCDAANFCGTGGTNMVCAVFDAPDADLDVGFDYGICMAPEDCFDLASRLPGGLGCYDVNRSRLK